MRYLWLLPMLFLFGCGTTVRAETVAIEFTYTGEADSYTLYMDETSYCSVTEVETNAASNFEMSCDPINIDPGWHSFTMTATKGTEETKHSNEFQWFKDFDEEPTKPTVITITIGINGEAVILQ